MIADRLADLVLVLIAVRDALPVRVLYGNAGMCALVVVRDGRTGSERLTWKMIVSRSALVARLKMVFMISRNLSRVNAVGLSFSK